MKRCRIKISNCPAIHGSVSLVALQVQGPARHSKKGMFQTLCDCSIDIAKIHKHLINLTAA